MGIKKLERIRGVVEQLLLSGKFNKFSKGDIEKAIIIAREPLDDRTINNWFRLLWKLEYVTQPTLGIYVLNIMKIEELELPLPTEIDPKQSRL